MAEEIRVWQVGADDRLIEVAHAKLNLEERIENWLSQDISILAHDLLVIGKQVATDFGGWIDLLCLDEDGNPVIVELKRDKTPREITAQVLDYGSWVKGLSAERISTIASEYLKGPLEEAFIHKDRPDAERFRNPNGVYTKLCNFLRLDPNYHGARLTHGGAGDKAVWKEFAGNPRELARVAAAIRARVGKRGNTPSAERSDLAATEPDEDEFPEGRVLFRAHRSRGRNRHLIEQVKRRALRLQGRLACQACEFVFKERYGDLGDGYIECHHVVPVSQLSPEAKTKISDIALLCSNCHRMVHRRRPWLSMAELKSLLTD